MMELVNDVNVKILVLILIAQLIANVQSIMSIKEEAQLHHVENSKNQVNVLDFKSNQLDATKQNVTTILTVVEMKNVVLLDASICVVNQFDHQIQENNHDLIQFLKAKSQHWKMSQKKTYDLLLVKVALQH
jgi:GTPase involved in cell partitioning and DNA repair